MSVFHSNVSARMPVCFAFVAALYGASAWAAVDIAVWHTLKGSTAQSFTHLVERFNTEQSEVKVVLKGFEDAQALQDQLVPALASGNAPMWVQWMGSDAHTLYKLKAGAFESVQDVIKPFSKDAASLSAAALAPFLDEHGKWQALPLTPAVPVIMYRSEYLKKAGIEPVGWSLRNWRDLQTAAVKFRDGGYSCGVASIEPAWTHIENIASWHNQPYATKNNGRGGANPEFLFNDLLHVRHVALMISWVKSDLMYAKKGDGALGRWANGECPMALGPSTSMAAVGPIESSKLGVAPMPLWEEVSTQQGGLFPDGGGLYLTTQTNTELKKAAQKFGAWWLTPVVAAEWHQKSGSVPFTEAAYLATKKGGFYTSVPGWESLSARLAAPSTKLVTPLHIADRKRVLALIEVDLEKAFAAGKASKAALDDAVRSANALASQATLIQKNTTKPKKL